MGVAGILAESERLLHRPDELYEAVAAGDRPGPRIARLLALSVLASVPFGMACGAYVGGEQVWITGAKMPVLFLFTLGVCAPLLTMILFVAGQKLTVLQSIEVALISIAATSVCLGSLTPVMLLFSLSLRLWNHNHYVFLILLLTTSVGFSGIVSLRFAWRALGRLGAGAARLRILVAWIVVYQFVGCQVAWVLRPFIGRSSDTIRFEGNIYEAIPMLVRNFFHGMGG